MPGSTRTSETLKRRSYWIPGDPKVIIIHYLDEAIAGNQNKNKSEILTESLGCQFTKLNFSSPMQKLGEFTEKEASQFPLDQSDMKSMSCDIKIGAISPTQIPLMNFPNPVEEACQSMSVKL